MPKKKGGRKGAGRPRAPLTQAGKDAIMSMMNIPRSVQAFIQVQKHYASRTIPYTEAGKFLQRLVKDTHPLASIDALEFRG